MPQVYIQISRPAGFAPGANDFYATTAWAYVSEFRGETEALGGATIDTIASAEPLAVTTDPGKGKRKTTGVVAFLPAGDALDNFSFPVTSGDKLTLSCSSTRGGSGLSQFKVDLIQGGTSLQSETETNLADIAWYTSTSSKASRPEVKIAATGTATLQLSAGARSATNAGVYYFCAVILVSP